MEAKLELEASTRVTRRWCFTQPSNVTTKRNTMRRGILQRSGEGGFFWVRSASFGSALGLDAIFYRVFGPPGRTRTCNLRLRRPLHYPVVLRAAGAQYPIPCRVGQVIPPITFYDCHSPCVLVSSYCGRKLFAAIEQGALGSLALYCGPDVKTLSKIRRPLSSSMDSAVTVRSKRSRS